jgi:hypothetical protein
MAFTLKNPHVQIAPHQQEAFETGSSKTSTFEIAQLHRRRHAVLVEPDGNLCRSPG